MSLAFFIRVINEIDVLIDRCRLICCSNIGRKTIKQVLILEKIGGTIMMGFS